jgi:hypothetical protein
MDSIIVVGELCQIQLAFGSRGVYPGLIHPFHPAQPGIKPTQVDVLFQSSHPLLLSHNKPLEPHPPPPPSSLAMAPRTAIIIYSMYGHIAKRELIPTCKNRPFLTRYNLF